MEQLLDVSLGSVSLKSAALRLLGAIVLGGLVGWEREVSARAAGLRTHMMIALAAAVFAILGMELSAFDVAEGVEVQADPLRLIEAVTSGVAFLAAGSIIFSGGSVRGVTTGASMWLCGAIGLSCGIGDIYLGALTTLLALVVLWLIRVLVEPLADRMRHDPPPDDEEGGSRQP